MKLIYKGASLNYAIHGHGQPVVMLHGFLENSTMWLGLIESLSKSHQVICPDLLGHGKSDCIGYIHTMEDMADGVYTILQHLKITKAIIIGHSMGGYVALALAEKYSNLIAGLCLLNSTANSDSSERKINRERAIEQVKINAQRFIKISIKNLFRPKNQSIFSEQIKFLQYIMEIKSTAQSDQL